ncbi:hypothetical protein CR513_32356, partial [Mucuna pruriens]
MIGQNRKTQLRQRLSQRSNIDFEEIYSHVVDAIAYGRLNLHQMDTIIAYLYNSLDNDIYMKLSKEFNLHKTHSEGYQEDYSIKLNDINIIAIPEKLLKAIDCLKKEFDMKDLTNFCLGFQLII